MYYPCVSPVGEEGLKRCRECKNSCHYECSKHNGGQNDESEDLCHGCEIKKKALEMSEDEKECGQDSAHENNGEIFGTNDKEVVR